MMAAYQELEIEEGADWTDELLVVDANGDPIDLTGYTAESDIKRSIDDADALIEMSTTNGRIVITPLTGSVMRVLSNTETTGLDWRTAVHDLKVISAGGIVTRICAGPVKYSRQVTV